MMREIPVCRLPSPGVKCMHAAQVAARARRIAMRQPFRPQARHRHDLRHDQRLYVRLPAGTRCRVVYGNAWITQTDDFADHFLRHGEMLTLTTYGNVLIEALTQTRIEIVEQPRPAAPLLALVAAGRASVERSLRRLRGRLQFGGPRLGDAAS
jgi:hypothetical protein